MSDSIMSIIFLGIAVFALSISLYFTSRRLDLLSRRIFDLELEVDLHLLKRDNGLL